MKILIKVTLNGKPNYVQRVDVANNAVQMTLDQSKAMKFRSDAEVNHWLDLYVNCGMGLSWSQDIKLLKFT